MFPNPNITIEVVTDPAQIDRYTVEFAAARLNWRWLEEHWGDVLPQAEGKYLAVAGKKPFIADTPEEALGAAQAAFPDDLGAIVQFVSSHKGPRIYAHQRYIGWLARMAGRVPC